MRFMILIVKDLHRESFVRTQEILTMPHMSSFCLRPPVESMNFGFQISQEFTSAGGLRFSDFPRVYFSWGIGFRGDDHPLAIVKDQ